MALVNYDFGVNDPLDKSADLNHVGIVLKFGNGITFYNTGVPPIVNCSKGYSRALRTFAQFA